ncbi:ABC transporter permease [Nocardioides zeae]|uniref:Ribose transport system permease protein n=1 Tax=Nocardioides zeae TaxID=1457234 RepID=A0AAJ1U8H5_9ACTN|nr:ABC transporter permease [Nocardioides zeae]MDQ1105432.1 ribose transport system permease protein [Nocardioides zeae]
MTSTTNLETSTPAEVTDVPPVAPQRRGGRARVRRLAERYGLLGVLALVVVVFSVLPATGTIFASSANIQNLLGGQVVLVLVATAFTLPLVVGKLDLSTASIAGIASVATAASMSRADAPVVLAVAIGLVVGLALGAVNGYLIAVQKLDSIVVTLAMMTIIAGVVSWYTGGIAINTGIPEGFSGFGTQRWLGVPVIFYLMTVVVLAVLFVVEKTPWGRFVRMIGSNESAARLVGLPTERLTFSAFLFSGLIAGIAGVLLTVRTGGANPGDGPGYLLSGLAAVYIGATTIQPGRFNILGTVLGVFLVATTVTGLTLAGVAPFVQQLFNGGALLVAVILSQTLARARPRPRPRRQRRRGPVRLARASLPEGARR